MNNKKITVNIGMFTIGLQAYWSQMPGMKDEILEYSKIIEGKLSTLGKVFNLGIIDNIKDARKAEELFISKDIDIIIIHCATYGLSSIVAAAIRRCNVPILTLHLQPVDNFLSGSYDTSYTLPKNTFAASGELGEMLKRTNKVFHCICGKLYDDIRPWDVIKEWTRAVSIKKALRKCNIGVIGNYFSGMTDLYVDGLLLIDKLGINLEFLEIANLRKLIEIVSDNEINKKYEFVRQIFNFDNDINKEKLKWCLKVAVGMEKLINEFELNALAFHYSGYPDSIEEKIGYSLTLGGTLLTGSGIPCVAEGDIKVAIAMFILGFFNGGATQAEHYYADYNKQVNYVSHSGPGDYSIANKKPLLKWLDFFHGKRGSGVSCEFSIKEGPITLLSLVLSENNDLKFAATEGIALPNYINSGEVTTRIKFSPNIREFIEKWTEEGPSHHSAMGLGHHIREIEKVAEVLGIKMSII